MVDPEKAKRVREAEERRAGEEAEKKRKEAEEERRRKEAQALYIHIYYNIIHI